MGVIDEVKQKVDLIEIVSQYATLTKAGRNFRALCPFHSEQQPSFYVYPEQQSWHCFGACSTGGDVFSFIMKKENIDFGEALRLLAQGAGISVPTRFKPEAGKEEKKRLYQANEAAARYFHNLLVNSAAGEKARSYLSGRGLSSKTIADFQLGFSSGSREALKRYLIEREYSEEELVEVGLVVLADDGKTYDRFRNRLMFPIRDARGQIIGFGGRVLDGSMPKYLNSPQSALFDKGGNLYGLDLASSAIRQQKLAVIVEGYMDVITAHQNGFNNVVASMGTALTEKQLSALKRLTNCGQIVLALDADAAGEEAALRSLDYENRLDIEVRFAILPEGKDPDNVIRDDAKTWQDTVHGALAVVDYTFTRDETLAVDRLLPIIARIKNDLRRDRYITKLARLSGYSYSKLESALQGYIVGQKVKKPRSEAVKRSHEPLLSSPLEEYCLALLLKYPELKVSDNPILPEYFENSVNREIFIAWQQADDLSSLKDRLDTIIWEYLDTLTGKEIMTDRIEQRYDDCVLNLRKRFLQNLEAKRARVLALEAEMRGNIAELAKLQEQGIGVSIQLGEVFNQKARSRGENKWS